VGQGIFKNVAAKAKLEAWYDRFLLKIAAPFERRTVSTACGPSHVLVVGNASNPPLVCVHGALGSSAHAASERGPLVERFQVFLPDVPGQSVRGTEMRLSLDTDAHARWLVDVINALGLTEVNLYGVSWGGYIALQTALALRGRVRKLVLLVPAGLVGGSAWAGITQVAIPLTRYRCFPNEKNLQAFYNGLFSTWDADWAHYLGDAVQSFVLNLRAPPLARKAEFSGYETPTFVLGGRDDVHFRGDRLIERAKDLMPHAHVAVLDKCKHGPPTTTEFRTWMADRVTAFILNQN